MEHASAAARVVSPIDAGLLAAAAQRAADEIEAHDEPAKAIEAAIDALYEAVAGAMPSVFVLEHGRLWLVAQRGYAVVPDGITVESGITGTRGAARARSARDRRAVGSRLRRRAPRRGVRARDPTAVGSRRHRSPQHRVRACAPRRSCRCTSPTGPRAHSACRRATGAAHARSLGARSSLRASRKHSRSSGDCGARGCVASPCPPLEATQIVVWGELGTATQLASWSSDAGTHSPLSLDELETARVQTDPSVVCQVLELGTTTHDRGRRTVVWLPLRANAGELGAMVGSARNRRTSIRACWIPRLSWPHMSPRRSTPRSRFSESG